MDPQNPQDEQSSLSASAQPKSPPKNEVESETWASPIEIDTSKGVGVDLGAVDASGLLKPSVTTRLVNTGSGISVALTGHEFIFAPFLREKYRFVDLTFHYNVDDNNGSEHIIDEKSYAMEAHFLFVHTYTIDITRDLLEAYKLYDDYRTDRTPIPDTDDSASMLDDKRRYSPTPSAVTFFEPSGTGLEEGEGDDRGELSPLEKQKKKLDRLEQSVFIERWNKERTSRAFRSKRQTTHPKTIISDASLLRLKDPSILTVEGNAEGAKSALDRRQVKKYETKAKRSAEKKAHDLASSEYPKWRRRQISSSDLNEQSTTTAKRDSRTTIASGGNENESASQLSMKPAPYKETEKTKAELKKIQFKTISIYCCIAVQFELDENAPPYNLFSYLPNVKEPFKEILVDGNLLLDFDEAFKSTDFCVYHGSLAARPYTRGVQWVVMKNPLKISAKQMAALRSVKNSDGEPTESRFLGIQAWDNRKIWVNKPREVEQTMFTCPGKNECTC